MKCTTSWDDAHGDPVQLDVSVPVPLPLSTPMISADKMFGGQDSTSVPVKHTWTLLIADIPVAGKNMLCSAQNIYESTFVHAHTVATEETIVHDPPAEQREVRDANSSIEEIKVGDHGVSNQDFAMPGDGDTGLSDFSIPAEGSGTGVQDDADHNKETAAPNSDSTDGTGLTAESIVLKHGEKTGDTLSAETSRLANSKDEMNVDTPEKHELELIIDTPEKHQQEIIIDTPENRLLEMANLHETDMDVEEIVDREEHATEVKAMPVKSEIPALDGGIKQDGDDEIHQYLNVDEFMSGGDLGGDQPVTESSVSSEVVAVESEDDEMINALASNLNDSSMMTDTNAVLSKQVQDPVQDQVQDQAQIQGSIQDHDQFLAATTPSYKVVERRRDLSLNFLEELGYDVVNQYWIKGVRFFYGDIIIEIYKVFVRDDDLPSGKTNIPLKLLDVSNTFQVKTYINIPKATDVELISMGVKQLQKLKDLLKSLFVLGIPDRTCMDMRVKK